MEKYSEVLGLPVICAADGKKIGIIKDVIFCPKNKRVIAYQLERKGFQILKRVILSKDILNLGKDAMIINDYTCAKELKNLKSDEEFQNKGDIKGLKVFSISGADFGIVQDVLFDWKTGVIEGIEVSDGLMQDIMQGRNVLPLFGKVEFGEENVLVDKEAVEEMMDTGGGLKKKLMGG